MEAVRILEDEVRELIRRRGVDPQRDPDGVRRLVQDATEDYDARSLIGSLPLLPDRAEAAKTVFDSVAGFGVLQPLLDDETVEEIWIHSPSRA